jgi:hypothetical protein
VKQKRCGWKYARKLTVTGEDSGKCKKDKKDKDDDDQDDD